MVASIGVGIVTQFEILQTECTQIGGPTVYKANTTQLNGVSCSGGVGSHEPCFVPGSQALSKSSCSWSWLVFFSCSKGRQNIMYIVFHLVDAIYVSVLQNTVDNKVISFHCTIIKSKGGALVLLIILVEVQCHIYICWRLQCV